MMGKIGVYGGSFNPIHMGHLRAAQEVAREFQLDRVLMIPTNIAPHKQQQDYEATGLQRLEMVRLAIADLPQFEACDLELKREGKSYTVDTLTQLKQMFPKDELYLIMGTDMFLSLHNWYRPDEICALAHIICAGRDGTDAAVLQAQAKNLQENLNAKVHLAENRVLKMSSTTVRRMVFFDCAQAYLPGKVYDYIRRNRLYYAGANLRYLPFEELKRISLSLHKPSRVPHVIGCCETAQKLAARWGENVSLAARAGILHDVTKALDAVEQLRVCEKYGIILDDFIIEHHKLLHSKTAAAIAEHIFGEARSVVNAIYWHTTGRANMSTMEKILYIADYAEPNRSFDGVEKIRCHLYEDLDLALYTGFSMSLEELQREGKAFDKHSYEAWRYLKEERNFG